MTSPTRWTWVWVSSGSWWWTGKKGLLQSMESQRAGHDWGLNWTEQTPRCWFTDHTSVAILSDLAKTWCFPSWMHEQINQSIDQSANVDILQLQINPETRICVFFWSRAGPPFETGDGLSLPLMSSTYLSSVENFSQRINPIKEVKKKCRNKGKQYNRSNNNNLVSKHSQASLVPLQRL